MNKRIQRAVSAAALAFLVWSVTAAPAVAQGGGTEYDIVIRNGRVLDGAGNPWILADVAIKDGRFAKIGIVKGKGRREIDARGKYVSPGWIDMLDQSGSVLARNGLAESKLIQGVTTLIAGESGTPVPAEELAAYFAKLEADGISVNFGTSFAERQARVAVLGADDRDPDAEEMKKMAAIVETAMRAGALGISTALIYPPASYAETAELTEMARVAGRYGGFYSSHIRGEGAELIEAISEAIEIGEKSGVPVEIFHLKAAYQPGWGTLMRKAGETIEAARARGVDVTANMYLYEAGGTGLAAVVPSWASDGGNEKLLERLRDPAVRERLKKEIKTGSPGWWNIVEAAGGWERVVLVNAANEANERFENKNLAQIAKEWNKDPADAAFDLILEGKGRVSALYFMMSEADIETALRFPWTSLGSDASASLEMPPPDTIGMGHPRGYGNFPRLIAGYVRDKQVISLPEAVRKLTSWPATRMRLDSRGMIKEGLWADVVIFDYETIADRATYEKPYARPEGIEIVLVNGRVVLENGKHTLERPGRVIYGPGRETPGQ